MVPYMILSLSTKMAFQYSIGIGAFALLAFGFLKGRLSNLNTRGCFISSVQMFMVGAFATGASYGMIRLMQEMKMTKDLH
jgi:VIT1/CCC1 family predicted Fe2+/Mn2+ transporter